MSAEDVEVERLKSLVKDLELQNIALKKSSQKEESELHNQQTRHSLSSEDDFLDLSAMGTLDDDASWLYSSPVRKQELSPSQQSVKINPAVFETPEVLPWRRALSQKLHNIEKGVAPIPASLFPMRCSPMQSPVKPSPGTPSSLNSSYTSDGSVQSPRGAGDSSQQVHKYMESVLGHSGANNSEAAVKAALADTCVSCTATISSQPAYSSGTSSQSANSSGSPSQPAYSSGTSSQSANSSGSPSQPAYSSGTSSQSANSSGSPSQPAYSSGTSSQSANSSGTPSQPAYNSSTFTRPKKKKRVPAAVAASSDSSSSENVALANGSHQSSAADNQCNGMGAGDSTTYVLNRGKTRTIESSEVLEAQRLITSSPQSLTGDEDSLGMLPPDRTFKRRSATGNREDKSKRESLDIQTLAKLQEQSLRDSLTAVRKASSSSAGSNGVPGLNFSDLDSSNGSLSSINDDAHEQAERKAMQGSGTFRIKKSPRRNGSPSPTVELNGDTPIIHKSVVNSRSPTGVPEAKQKPQIRSSLSPRTIQAPKASGLRKPNSSLPTPARTRSRTGGVPTPTSRSGLRPPTSKSYSSR